MLTSAKKEENRERGAASREMRGPKSYKGGGKRIGAGLGLSAETKKRF